MQPYNRYSRLSLVLLLASMSLFSCKKKKEDDPTPVETSTTETPSTAIVYTADAANYADATTLIAMFDELIAETEKGNTKGTPVSAATLKSMFKNENNPFSTSTLNGSVLKLSDFVHPDAITTLNSYFDQLEVASQSKVTGSKDTAGVIINENASSKKLYDNKGYAIYELIEKNLMGSLQLYQITAVQLADSSLDASVSNTKRLKKWDMAFGYLGVPKDYSNVTTVSLPFWASYLKKNDATLGGNIMKIMNAFVNGRKAIENNDNDAVKSNAKIIKEELDKAAIGMSLYYLFNARFSLKQGYIGRTNGGSSEGIGFLNSAKFNPSRKISDLEINNAINILGSSNYQLTVSNIESAISTIATPYGFDANPATSKFNTNPK